jgi:hypothetical protein
VLRNCGLHPKNILKYRNEAKRYVRRFPELSTPLLNLVLLHSHEPFGGIYPMGAIGTHQRDMVNDVRLAFISNIPNIQF